MNVYDVYAVTRIFRPADSRWRTFEPSDDSLTGRDCDLAPQVMAALRNLAITLMHRCGQFHIASARRHFSYHPHEALALLVAIERSCRLGA